MTRLAALKNLRPAPRRPSPRRLFAQDGLLEVRLTRKRLDIMAAQALRYRVFYDEMGATPTPRMRAKRRDFDRYDRICDHVLVLDHQRLPGDKVIGTYRILRQEVAVQHGGFYSAGEFDISKLLRGQATSGQLMEMGRSCVAAEYRNTATIQLLWRGIANYMLTHNITLVIGCASFPGTDPALHAAPLSYLHHHHMAPPETRVRALPHLYQPINLMNKDAISPREALRAMPPLVKAYLRVGAYVGDGAVIDYQFATTDVFMILPTERVAERYHTHFEREEEFLPAVAGTRRKQLLGKVLPLVRRRPLSGEPRLPRGPRGKGDGGGWGSASG